jgi:hypothetical protein
MACVAIFNNLPTIPPKPQNKFAKTDPTSFAGPKAAGIRYCVLRCDICTRSRQPIVHVRTKDDEISHARYLEYGKCNIHTDARSLHTYC